ncbi:MAG: YybH family protein, partial [Chloroflexota bacterium]
MIHVIEATQHFLQGDAAGWKAVWSHDDDVTLFGGRGAYERGWAQLAPRFDWIAATYAESRDFASENISTVVGADLAYAVGIERSRMRFQGREDFGPVVLRVTHIYRRGDDGWKLVHRHADSLVEVKDTREIYP